MQGFRMHTNALTEAGGAHALSGTAACVTCCCCMQVVATLQKLPMETVVTAAELEQETPQQLKQRLAKAGISCNGCIEKRELISKVLEIGGSSGSSCSICCEDYAAGDVVRVLPCKHRYHIECVDR
eukprot:GHUV01023841.1.p1 GENE.GHUV01023841.1~~GHUV01023841.1.p1  ORF type:complete len:126 (+),score=41.51 GHUV01023841.1:1327-1704(+)